MPLFIILNLSLSFLQQTDSVYLELFTTNRTVFVGLTITVLGLIIALMKLRNFKIWYDLVASGVLLIWFADWYGQFQDDAPMFFFFPLYFCFLTVFVTFFFINQREQIDEESLRYLKSISNVTALHIAIIIFLFISLLLKNHFLLFPISMSFFILRFTLISCIEGR